MRRLPHFPGSAADDPASSARVRPPQTAVIRPRLLAQLSSRRRLRHTSHRSRLLIWIAAHSGPSGITCNSATWLITRPQAPSPRNYFGETRRSQWTEHPDLYSHGSPYTRSDGRAERRILRAGRNQRSRHCVADAREHERPDREYLLLTASRYGCVGECGSSCSAHLTCGHGGTITPRPHVEASRQARVMRTAGTG